MVLMMPEGKREKFQGEERKAKLAGRCFLFLVDRLPWLIINSNNLLCMHMLQCICSTRSTNIKSCDILVWTPGERASTTSRVHRHGCQSKFLSWGWSSVLVLYLCVNRVYDFYNWLSPSDPSFIYTLGCRKVIRSVHDGRPLYRYHQVQYMYLPMRMVPMTLTNRYHTIDWG